MNNSCESMYARHRNAAGITQERAAELLGVAVRTLQARERGESTPPNARVLAMCDIYCSPTLAIEHLRYNSIIAYDVLPAVRAVPVAQAVCSLVSSIRKLEEIHAGDRLLEIAADGGWTRSSGPTLSSCSSSWSPSWRRCSVFATRWRAEGMAEKIELLTKAEVAEILTVSEDTVDKLIKGGQLPAYRIAKTCTRVDRADVMEYLEGRRIKAAALRKARVRVPSEARRGGVNNSGYTPGMKVV